MSEDKNTVVKPMWGPAWILLIIVLFCLGMGIKETIEINRKQLVDHQYAVWTFKSDIPSCLVEGVCYLHVTEKEIREIHFEGKVEVKQLQLDESIYVNLPPLGRVIYRASNNQLRVGDVNHHILEHTSTYTRPTKG